MTERRYVWRVFAVTVATLAVWLGLGSRLAFLHLSPNETLRAKVEGIRRMEQTILGRRGRILDRSGNILALDLAVKNVCADPKVILENGQVSRVGTYLAHMLELPPSQVFSRLNRPGRRFEYIKRYVHEDLATQVQRLQLEGVFLRDDSARNYPLGAMMAHVLGFSNLEGIGSAGVELEMDMYLRGRPGLRVTQKDAKGREVYLRRDLEIEPQPGADVYLTIDEKLQYLVEKALDGVMNDTEQSALGCWAIVEHVRTGEILAMASRPSYDLNQYRRATPEVMRNGNIGYVYEPGSTFKGPVLAAAFNEGLVSEHDEIFCEDGIWFYRGRPLRDYHAYGTLTVADVLKKSSNIGMAKIALSLGEKRLERYIRDFGFGRRTGIDLPGEETGILHDLSQWSSLSVTRIAMGHEIAATALQVLNAYCCIGNNGFLMKPYVVRQVVDARGTTVFTREPEVVKRPIRPETARLMWRLLARVTEPGGTARRARFDDFAVAGKTGTAQKPIPGGYSDTAHMASFVGFLPAQQPEIGIIVVVDEPQPLHTGGTVAAPVFREIAEQAVRYLDIPPYDPGQAVLLTRLD